MKKRMIALSIVMALSTASFSLANDKEEIVDGGKGKGTPVSVVAGSASLPLAAEIEDEKKVDALMPKPLEISKEDPPVRLRDRLIMVEKRFVEHAARMDAHEKEVASMLLRLKTLEQMLYEQGPIVLGGGEAKEIDLESKRELKPYRFSN